MKKLAALILGGVLSVAGLALAGPAHADNTASNYTALTPGRALDTRRTTPFGPGEARAVSVGNIPVWATSVVLNVTATEPTSAGYLTVFPPGTPVPLASN